MFPRQPPGPGPSAGWARCRAGAGLLAADWAGLGVRAGEHRVPVCWLSVESWSQPSHHLVSASGDRQERGVITHRDISELSRHDIQQRVTWRTHVYHVSRTRLMCARVCQWPRVTCPAPGTRVLMTPVSVPSALQPLSRQTQWDLITEYSTPSLGSSTDSPVSTNLPSTLLRCSPKRSILDLDVTLCQCSSVLTLLSKVRTKAHSSQGSTFENYDNCHARREKTYQNWQPFTSHIKNRFPFF